MSSFKDRVIRAAKLDPDLYEEVEQDTTAMNQAVLVVILASAAAGLTVHGRVGAGGIIAGIIISLIGWVVWAYLTYYIGTKLLPEPQTQSNPGELLRTIGFSSAPGMIRIAGVIPGLAGPVFFIASVWMLIAMVVAVKQALDYQSTVRAVAVCAIGWIVQMLFVFLVFSIYSGTVEKQLPKHFM